MTDSACYDFNANYFDLPFSNELKPVSKQDQEVKHVIVYARECSRGYMIFSDAHKHFLFTNAKHCKQLIGALEGYANSDNPQAIIYYTLSSAGIPQYGSAQCTDGRYWVEDITGFSFMDATWNGRSVSDASNPFLIPGAEGETAPAVPAHEEPTAGDTKQTRRKSKGA